MQNSQIINSQMLNSPIILRNNQEQTPHKNALSSEILLIYLSDIN